MVKVNPKLPINIILLGDPAAGKATQAAFLVQKFRLYDFDMGKELYRQRTLNPALDFELQRHYDQGKLTPTAIVRKILSDTIEAVSRQRGILFDGTPKMLGEAKLVVKLLADQGRTKPTVIYLTIPLEETVSRIQSRKGYFSGKYGKRADDTEDALKNRARYYRKNIAEVVAFFQRHYRFVRINGLGKRAEVRQRIVAALDKHEKLHQTTR